MNTSCAWVFIQSFIWAWECSAAISLTRFSVPLILKFFFYSACTFKFLSLVHIPQFLDVVFTNYLIFFFIYVWMQYCLNFVLHLQYSLSCLVDEHYCLFLSKVQISLLSLSRLLIFWPFCCLSPSIASLHFLGHRSISLLQASAYLYLLWGHWPFFNQRISKSYIWCLVNFSISFWELRNYGIWRSHIALHFHVSGVAVLWFMWVDLDVSSILILGSLVQQST